MRGCRRNMPTQGFQGRRRSGWRLEKQSRSQCRGYPGNGKPPGSSRPFGNGCIGIGPESERWIGGRFCFHADIFAIMVGFWFYRERSKYSGSSVLCCRRVGQSQNNSFVFHNVTWPVDWLIVFVTIRFTFWNDFCQSQSYCRYMRSPRRKTVIASAFNFDPSFSVTVTRPLAGPKQLARRAAFPGIQAVNSPT